MDFLGFRRESAPAGATAPPVFFPCLKDDEERCMACDTVRSREKMVWVSDDDYVCLEPCGNSQRCLVPFI